MRKVIYVTTSDGSFRLTEQLLADEGIEVLQMRTGISALSTLPGCEAPPDLLLVDWQLAVMNAVEFVGAARALPRFEAVPIIVFSEPLTHGQLSALYAAGVNAVVKQPASLDEATDLSGAIKAFWLHHALLSVRHRARVSAV